VSELTVKRWRRYGKDRLYVNLPNGERVGWVDLQTGETTIEREDLREGFDRALREYGHEGPHTSSQVRHTPIMDEASTDDEPEPGPSQGVAAGSKATDHEPFAVTIAWRDLGARRAGQAAAEQAVQERKAAPVKTLAARVLGVHTDERAWRIGAVGERRVAEQLDKLPEPWQALHAIPVGDRGADIDHLVTGPGGVFTINAKHHPDANIWVGGNTVMVNGHRQPYVRNSRHEAERAGRLLSNAIGGVVGVTGVVAIVGAHKGFVIKSQPDNVRVVARKALVGFLTSLPTVLDGSDIEVIYRAARRSDTWQSSRLA
jgi:hypothetical protein